MTHSKEYFVMSIFIILKDSEILQQQIAQFKTIMDCFQAVHSLTWQQIALKFLAKDFELVYSPQTNTMTHTYTQDKENVKRVITFLTPAIS